MTVTVSAAFVVGTDPATDVGCKSTPVWPVAIGVVAAAAEEVASDVVALTAVVVAAETEAAAEVAVVAPPVA